jgi:hypothetical protein
LTFSIPSATPLKKFESAMSDILACLVIKSELGDRTSLESYQRSAATMPKLKTNLPLALPRN